MTPTGSRSSDSDSSSDDDGSSSEEEEDQKTMSGSGYLARRQSLFALAGGGDSSSVAADSASYRSNLSTSQSNPKRKSGSDVGEGDSGSVAESQRDKGDAYRPPWETLLGLPSGVWEKLLSPSRTWHKRRFELGINDLAFVGWPVFVREDGTWKKQRRKKRKDKAWEGGELGHNEHEDNDEAVDDAAAPSNSREGGSKSDAAESRPKTAEGSNKPSSKDQQDAANGGDKDSMTMFNVVFVLHPPVFEYSTRIKEKYDNVVKKLGKALKWDQAKEDYVWKEAQKILHLREKAREKQMTTSSLYAEILHTSSLAKAISTIYDSISNSRIASVTLSPQTSISLQIPPLTSTSVLPAPTEQTYPGLWLTTADSMSPVDEVSGGIGPHPVLAKHFALLLLDNEAAILRDIETSGGNHAQMLAHYIRSSKPTKSFAQISAISGIPLRDIQLLASHLIYWRRARAVPPLHHRDTYIVSPNADMSKLSAATAAYAVAFPTLPSLPKMLSALSGTPRPFSVFIPSKDHKDIYFSILAWMLRGGWVTQLRAFAWVKVTPEIKMAVAEKIRREEELKRESAQLSNSIASLAMSTDTAKNVGANGTGDDDDDAASSSSSSLDDQSLDEHAVGEDTPIPGRYALQAQTQSNGRRYPGLHRIRQDPNEHRKPSASLILHPHRASPLESRWLDEILASFPERFTTGQGQIRRPGQTQAQNDRATDADGALADEALQKHWSVFTKYFNGHDTLEKIPVREGLKRKVAWRMLLRMGINFNSPNAVLDPREKVLLGVRHW